MKRTNGLPLLLRFVGLLGRPPGTFGIQGHDGI
jgi:hypothetical protein